jgi:phosphatidylserine/phosphatidylglycerophosphate/cardiolipin synthase-like enzyme
LGNFSPEEEIAPTIVKLIDNAQHSLDIAAFAFTHPDIANAVIRAHQRGVKVRTVMDMVNERQKYSLAPELIKAGIPLRVRHKRGFQRSYCQKSWMKPEAQAAIFSPSLKIVPAITAGSNVLPLSFRQ